MDCRSRTIRFSMLPISPVPAVTNSSCALNRRTRISAWVIPASFWKGTILNWLRRCRIKSPEQVRLVLLALSAVSVFSGCRQDMHNQPKFIPMRSSEFYADRRSARYPVNGTVPRLENAQLDKEQLDPNSYFLSGKHGANFGNELPEGLTLNPQFMQRGQERFNIYCTPCHSRVGNGLGAIVERGYKPAANLHDQVRLTEPVSHYFFVMTHGYGAMPDYSAQLTPEDRWAVAAYIRALQLSQAATEKDVPAGV